MGVAKVTLNGSTLIDVTQKTVTADKMLSSYTALNAAGENITGTIGNGSAFPPAVTITTNPAISLNSSTGVITASYSGSSYITPTVNSGYISAGTSGKISTYGTSTYQLATKSAETYLPGATSKTIGSNQWLTGAQTIAGDTNLQAGNIKSGVTIFGVSGTYEGGGGGGDSKENEIITRTINGSYSNTKVGIIGEYAFYGCYDLISATFPSAIDIQACAFYKCSSLTTISIPLASMIRNYAFEHCINLNSASFPLATYIGMSAFENCIKLTNISFPSVSNIAAGAFGSCSSLTTASFSLVTSMGNSVFNGCSNLTTAYFPLLSSIGNYAFANCISLTNITFQSATYIGMYAFYKCSSLTTANFSSVTSIGDYAFASCLGLTTANFSSVTYIGNYAFYRCTNLTNINFPALSSIGNSAFYYCQKLINISFPSVTYIGSSAFYWCSNLTTASFPALSSIGLYAFLSCSKLESLYLFGSSIPTMAGANVFYSTPFSANGYLGYFGSIFVPESLYSGYIGATYWSLYSSRIVSMTDVEIEALNS